MAEAGEMLESAEYCGNCYGTPAAPIEKWTSEGTTSFLRSRFRAERRSNASGPTRLESLFCRLPWRNWSTACRKRGTESDETVRRRLEAARREIAEARNYDYVVVNDTVEERRGTDPRNSECRKMQSRAETRS